MTVDAWRGGSELPRRSIDLASLLELALVHVDRAMRDLEAREARRRLEVIESYLPRLEARLVRLAALDGGAALAANLAQLVSRLDAEADAERARLASAPVEETEVGPAEVGAADPGASDAMAAEVEPAAAASEAGVDAAGECPPLDLVELERAKPNALTGQLAAEGPGTLPPVDEPAAAPPPAEERLLQDQVREALPAVDLAERSCGDDAEPPPDPERVVAELFPAAQQILDRSPHLNIDELEAEVAVLAARGRLAQARDARLDDMLGPFFGRLSRVAREQLNPVGRYVSALHRLYNCNWVTNLATWTAKLDAARVAAAEQRAAENLREAHVRDQKQIDARNAEVAAQILERIRGLVAGGGSPDLGALRERVLEYLRFSDVTRELTDLVAPFASAFDQGRELRALRRRLARNGVAAGGAAGARPDACTATEAAAAGEQPRADEAVQPDAGVHVIERDPAASPQPRPRDDPVASAPMGPSERPPPGPGRRSGTEVVDAYRGAFHGCRAVLVGGSRRAYTLPRLQSTFGYADVEWVENERSERADANAIADRIHRGRYDHVFLLARFASHALQDALKRACKETGVRFILVERGYGTSSLAVALQQAGVRAAARATA